MQRVCVLIYNGKYTLSFVRFSLPVGLPVSWIDKTDHWVLGQDRGKPIETNQLAGSGPNVNQTATSWTNTRYSECPVSRKRVICPWPVDRFSARGSYWGFPLPDEKLKLFFFTLNEIAWSMWNDGLFIYHCSFIFCTSLFVLLVGVSAKLKICYLAFNKFSNLCTKHLPLMSEKIEIRNSSKSNNKSVFISQTEKQGSSCIQQLIKLKKIVPSTKMFKSSLFFDEHKITYLTKRDSTTWKIFWDFWGTKKKLRDIVVDNSPYFHRPYAEEITRAFFG